MRRTILVAHSNSSVRETIGATLERGGYEVVYAESREQAVALASTLQFDAFLIDDELDRTNAIEVCRALRAIENYRLAPILVVTRNSEASQIEAAVAAGADDFIDKSANPALLRARLKTQLERIDYMERLERARKALKQYLPKRTLDVVETTSMTGMLPPPQEQDLAICFTDMRGFTAFSEETEPTRLFSLISALLAEQVDIIHRFGGYVDKFGGDGVMAIFDGPDMVLQSCLCALSILDSARVKDSAGSEQMRRFGIGIHTGRAVIGNIGSPDHLDYSAIGNTVNLAARLCGQAEATSIVVSKAVRDAVVSDPRLRFIAERQVPIRGIKEPVTIYNMVRP